MNMEGKKIVVEKVELPHMASKENDLFTTINCPSCQSITPAENIDLASKMGKCSGCQAVFSIIKDVSNLQQGIKLNEHLMKPEGVDVFYFKNDMEIETTQPLSVWAIIILSLAPFVFLFSTLFFFKEGGLVAIVSALISLLFTVMGVLRYVRRKQYKVYLNFYDNKLSILRRPGRKSSDKHYHSDDIEQVYVRAASDGIALCLIINGENGQRHDNILTRIPNIGHARYMEQEIEKYLDLPDRKVTGEL